MQLQHIGGCRTMLPQIIRAQPTQKRPAANAGAAAPTRTNAPTRVDGTHPAQSQAAQPPKSAPAAIAAAAASSRTKAPTQDDGPRTRPNPKRHSHPQSAPAAKAAAAAPGRISAPTRDEGPEQPRPAGQYSPRKTQGPNNPHPAAASRASGSNCGRRCSITYPA